VARVGEQIGVDYNTIALDVASMQRNKEKCRRKVEMLDYVGADCRGPKKMVGAMQESSHPLSEESRCTPYFADDFQHCLCQMRTKPTMI
jgi:hypothetical protein